MNETLLGLLKSQSANYSREVLRHINYAAIRLKYSRSFPCSLASQRNERVQEMRRACAELPLISHGFPVCEGNVRLAFRIISRVAIYTRQACCLDEEASKCSKFEFEREQRLEDITVTPFIK